MINNIKLKSPAKINLGLSIKGKLDSGYHQLETIYHEIPLFDLLEYTLTNDRKIKLSSNLEQLNNQTNLIYKVANFLQQTFSVNQGVAINLIKNIPIGSGLGGGSSNAATTIKALNSLWDLQLNHQELIKIASQFGSDCAFFIDGGCQIETQAGENALEFEQLPSLENCQLIIILPQIEILSKDAFAKINYQKINKTSLANLKLALKNRNLTQITKSLYNDFENWTFDQYPKLKQIKQQLTDLGAKGVLMSGKGSTIFAIFDQNKIIKKINNYQVYQFPL